MIETQCCSTPGPEAKASVPPARDPATATSRQEVICPGCRHHFPPARRNQKYCNPKCQKKATRNAARGPRETENRTRTERHYNRATWLSYDLNRMPPARQRSVLLALLEAASGGDAALRNILLDPTLLGADWSSAIGKLYPDTRCPEKLNIAKMVNSFCQVEWGCSVREAILDDGKPAGRRFGEAGPEDVNPPSALYWEASIDPVWVRPKVPEDQTPYDWRRIARAFGDRGWRRYFTGEELDLML